MAYAIDAIVLEPAPSYDYDVLAGVRYGMDGSPDGAPTYDVRSSSLWDGGWLTWDGNPDDGIDSGWSSVDLIISHSGVTWTVDGQSATIDAPSFNSINQIQIIADSSAQAMMSWQNVGIQFYSNNQVVDSWGSYGGPTIDETAEQNPIEKQDILTLTPQASNVDKVHLTAQVRMTCPQGVYLDQNSVFGQVLIKTA
jgi:hypothetical protein